MTGKTAESEWKYPASAPIDKGLLRVPGAPGHSLYWEEHGNPGGEPVIYLHGGPGAGFAPNDLRFFDPARYRVLIFDQRGCGKSIPHAFDDPEGALASNTTPHLLEDIERLREERNMRGKTHVFGGSWGSTLALAWAIARPETVETLILRGIFLCRRRDIDYFYQGNAAHYAVAPNAWPLPGAGMFFPDQWKSYVEVIPVEKRGDMLRAYADIFAMKPETAQDRALQEKAARAWSVWEGDTSALSLPGEETSFGDPFFAAAMARIENHYFINGAFLGGAGEKNRDNNYLLDNAHKIKDIPIHIVHGRYDQPCPLFQAEALVQALRAAGARDTGYHVTTAGHSRYERENVLALTRVMDDLPPMRRPGP